MRGIDLVGKLESLEEVKLLYLVEPVFPRIKVLGNLMKICVDTKNGIMRVIYYAFFLNVLWD